MKRKTIARSRPIGRPRKTTTLIDVGLAVRPEIREAIQTFAEHREWSISKAAAKLVELGLSVYYRRPEAIDTTILPPALPLNGMSKEGHG